MISQSTLPMRRADSDERARETQDYYDVSVGRAGIKTVVVPRAVMVLLLLVVSALIALSVYALSGRATMHDRLDFGELLALVRRYDRGSIGNDQLLASIAPVIADVLLFVPWGALAFLTFHQGDRRRAASYTLSISVGVAFALALVAWQNSLPTRVTGWYDAGWNVAGCIAGAILGDLRKPLRVRFA